MLIIRFQRFGKKNQPFFKIVLTDKKNPPRGKHQQELGWWNPLKKEGNFKKEEIVKVISQGAQVSDSVWNLFIKKGVIKGKKRAIKIGKPKKAEANKEQSKAEGEAPVQAASAPQAPEAK